MTSNWRTVALAAAMGAGAMGAQAAVSYSATLLEVPNAVSSAAWGVNRQGVIVGDWQPADAPLFDHQGFVLQDGVYTSLTGPAGALGSYAMGISDTGVVVGNYYTTRLEDPSSGQGPSTGFIYAGGSYESVQVPTASDTQVRGISPDGRYVSGYYTTASGDGLYGFVFDRGTQTFATLAGEWVLLHGVTSGGKAIGSEFVQYGSEVWENRREGVIYDVASGERADYMLGDGTTFRGTAFRGMNASGTLAGFLDVRLADSNPYEGAQQIAFVGSMGDYATFYIAGVGGATAAEGINDAGLVVGLYTDADGNQQALVATPVPEPSAWLLMLSGAGVVAGLAKRRRRAAAA
ncbi:PEP-CTERM sorting domain-containing protein [Pelomonas sp. KK5]|uniref:PEP-CTERM sorting domain-containing protein n=1 Tax=Pelomonas sp. KK5 TaxID=1855730 RepID=UPI00097BD929|nr:PEP-CTERM sorting domain-containing protein [Pelomonas sp. KK5]